MATKSRHLIKTDWPHQLNTLKDKPIIFQKLSLIILSRNLAEQGISEFFATTTGVYHVARNTVNRIDNTARPTHEQALEQFDPAVAFKFAKRKARQREFINDLTANLDFGRGCISYDELVADPQSLVKILVDLGFSRASGRTVESKQKKVVSKDISEMAAAKLAAYLGENHWTWSSLEKRVTSSIMALE